jgi:hypothetical protein
VRDDGALEGAAPAEAVPDGKAFASLRSIALAISSMPSCCGEGLGRITGALLIGSAVTTSTIEADGAGAGRRRVSW